MRNLSCMLELQQNYIVVVDCRRQRAERAKPMRGFLVAQREVRHCRHCPVHVDACMWGERRDVPSCVTEPRAQRPMRCVRLGHSPRAKRAKPIKSAARGEVTGAGSWALGPGCAPGESGMRVSKPPACQQASDSSVQYLRRLTSPALMPCLAGYRHWRRHALSSSTVAYSSAHPWTLVTFLQVRCGSASRVWRCGVSVWCYRLAGRPEREECASANFQPASNLSVQ